MTSSSEPREGKLWQGVTVRFKLDRNDGKREIDCVKKIKYI